MSRRVLLIEDNENNRYLATFLLETAGWQVTQAPDGPSGIAMAAQSPPQIILLDLQLPTMDGYEVARRLKACPDLAAVPIVAVTAFALLGDKQSAIDVGCQGYIEKPIDPDMFVQQVEDHLMAAGRQSNS